MTEVHYEKRKAARRRMKKYIVFIVSFTVLFTAAQIGSGWLLTGLYTPDISNANLTRDGGAVFSLPPIVSFAALLLIATLAFGNSQKSIKT